MDQNAAELDDPLLAPWLAPVDEASPCGPDLEYDNDFLELTQAAAGKAETQFSAAEPPDWTRVRSLAEALAQRTRDLRIARFWLRARLRLEGFAALPSGLRLIDAMLGTWWDTLHPLPEDGDAYARLNVLTELASVDTVLGDLRQALVVDDRAVGQVRVRDIEVALARLPARDDESPPSREQIEQMLRDAAGSQPGLAALPAQATAALATLADRLGQHVGWGDMPDFDPLRDMIAAVAQVMPAPPSAEGDASADLSSLDNLLGDTADSSSSSGRTRAGGDGALSGGVSSREEAVRAIDMVCAYLEHSEPSNPASLLLRRAQRLIDKNFLELVRELAPDALNEVARLMGVDPGSVAGESSWGDQSPSEGSAD
jgi:type VI secretion system protein ImpA